MGVIAICRICRSLRCDPRCPNAPEPPRERGPQGRRNDVAKINAVRERFPEDWKKVLELRKSNPAEARKLTRELVQRLDAPQPAAAAGKTDGK